MPAALPLHSFFIAADDLSGAADCAASFAAAAGPVPVFLHGGVPGEGRCALDTDTRAMDEASAVARVRGVFGAFGGAARAPQLVYKKIDSTLRGHVGAELAAALAAAPSFAAAVVAPSFPQQGRTFVDGRLLVHGRAAGESPCGGDLVAVLEAAALKPALLRAPAAGDLPARIDAALAGGARAIVVDAATDGELDLLAAALLRPSSPRLLVAGAAGLARALAVHAGQAAALAAQPRGPVLGVAGSFSAATAAQVAQVEQESDALVLRLSAQEWQGEPHAALRGEAVAAAHEALVQGRHVLFGIAGEVVQPFSRSLVQAVARAAAPLVREAGTCVLTGGDTARAMFEQLGLHCLSVSGEIEPGVSAGRAAAQGERNFILKAGGFGDASTLQRIIRRFGAVERAPS